MFLYDSFKQKNMQRKMQERLLFKQKLTKIKELELQKYRRENGIMSSSRSHLREEQNDFVDELKNKKN